MIRIALCISLALGPQGDADYAIQGEYEGEITGKAGTKLAAQVVSHGGSGADGSGGTFEISFFMGGFPGAGADAKKRGKASGRIQPLKSVFSGAGYSGEIGNRTLSGTCAEGPFRLFLTARSSPTMRAPPPAGAVFLFDGKRIDEWDNANFVQGNLLAPGATSRKKFRDVRLHAEFQNCFMPRARGQARSQSGIFLGGRHEVQIVDSFGLEPEIDGCGAVTGAAKPSVNMCLPPLSWQTLDIDYRMPRYDAAGRKTAHARMSVTLNGVKVVDDAEIKGSTKGGQPEIDAPGPIVLANNGHAVTFRNIWTVERGVLTVTDPAQGFPDIAIQGEYEGDVPAKGMKLAAQVVARGDGKYDAVLFGGGLPGAGWDGKMRLKAADVEEGGRDYVTGEGWSAGAGDGGLSGQLSDGVRFVLNRLVRKSPTEGATPPEGAVVLFDGKNADAWENAKVEGGFLRCGTKSRKAFRDIKVHLEFRTCFMARAPLLERSPGGVLFGGRHEVRILDGFGAEGGGLQECGALTGIARPRVNVCFPPLSWQTFDIEYRAPLFAGGVKSADARITVLHNGVKVQDDVELKGGPPEKDAPTPIHLQDHGSPVFFRNIWGVEPK